MSKKKKNNMVKFIVYGIIAMIIGVLGIFMAKALEVLALATNGAAAADAAKTAVSLGIMSWMQGQTEMGAMLYHYAGAIALAAAIITLLSAIALIVGACMDNDSGDDSSGTMSTQDMFGVIVGGLLITCGALFMMAGLFALSAVLAVMAGGHAEICGMDMEFAAVKGQGAFLGAGLLILGGILLWMGTDLIKSSMPDYEEEETTTDGEDSETSQDAEVVAEVPAAESSTSAATVAGAGTMATAAGVGAYYTATSGDSGESQSVQTSSAAIEPASAKVGASQFKYSHVDGTLTETTRYNGQTVVRKYYDGGIAAESKNRKPMSQYVQVIKDDSADDFISNLVSQRDAMSYAVKTQSTQHSKSLATQVGGESHDGEGKNSIRWYPLEDIQSVQQKNPG